MDSTNQSIVESLNFDDYTLREFKKTGHKLLKGIKIYRVNVNAYKAELMDYLSKNKSDFDLNLPPFET